MAKSSRTGEPVVIKKYANRRLYDTGSSSYITLDNLAQMVRDGVDFKVVDAKTNEDITHSVLTQIIVEQEAEAGQQMLPISFLRELIAMYGNSVQSMMPSYLEASMEHFRANQQRFQSMFEEQMGNNPFTKIAESNLAMMRAATEGLMPRAPQTKPDENARASEKNELATLREQMRVMQKKLDELGR